MNKFYTYFGYDKGKVRVRGYNNGRRFDELISYGPTLFVNSKNKETEYKALNGRSVEPIKFDSIGEARDFSKQYEDVVNFDVYGSTQWPYSYIAEAYPDIQYEVDLISVVNFDIEVGADEFPDPMKANWPITAITMEKGGKIVSLGCLPYNVHDDDVTYILCSDEEELLEKFLYYWANFDPDVITGWNIDGFDVPYIINRIRKVLGEESANRLSPRRRIEERLVKGKFGKETTVYELVGITALDYMALYKKFSFSNEESYSLDNIAFVTIGEKKMDYSEVATLNELYKTNFQKYMDYNIRDVRLVKKIDEKLGFIAQVFAIAYDAMVNFADTFTSVKIWEIIMYNYLMKQHIVPPKKTKTQKEKQIVGGHVKEVVPGQYKWVCSFDLNSLYPHLIMQYNISPETLAGVWDVLVVEGNVERSVDMILDGLITTEKTEKFKKQNVTMTAGGAFYTKEKRGFVPILMENMYNDRTVYKKKMLEEKKILVEIEAEMKKRGMKV